MADLSLSSKLKSLSPEQLANLRSQLAQQSQAAPIRPREQMAVMPAGLRSTWNGQDAWKATSTQARLWFLEQYLGPSPLYNIVRSLKLHGPLNIAALDYAFRQIVQRHEALRTNFHSIDGIPYQVINSDDRFKLEIVDLQAVPSSERSLIFQQQLREGGCQPFDLTQDCLLRAVVFQLEAAEFGLMITVHHTVGDGWSFGVLAKELSIFYRNYLVGNFSGLPPLPLQFIDYGLWLQTELQTGRRDRERTYWQQKLSGDLPVLNLPCDLPRGTAQTYRGQRASILFGSDFVREIKAISHQAGVSTFIMLLTSLKVLLHRYSQQTDIIVGAATANRISAEVENIFGYFVDNLPLRTDLSGNPSVWELLERVRQTALDAYAHPYPFAEILESLQISRNQNRSPLFSVTMSLQNTPEADLDLPEIRLASCQPQDSEWVEKAPISSYRFSQNLQVARFDLTILLKEEHGSISGVVEYNQDLFNADMIERFIGHWHTLLKAALANPQSSISHLPWLTPPEQTQLLAWSAPETDWLPADCLHSLFESQVAKHPRAIALQQGNQSLTYQELNQKANQLAHYLRKIGIQPDQLVGVYLERSLDLIVSLLAILKAGGAYLPLDRSYPTERLQFMLEDAEVSILIADQVPAALSLDRMQCVDLIADWPIISQASNINLTNINTPDHLAYVLYTSGSTGKPKGVMVPHQAVARLVLNTNYIDFQPSDVVAQVSNCCFDAATFEIWGALLNGAQLNIIDKDQLLSLQGFAQQIQAQSISILFLTTALLNQFAQTIPEAFQSLRYLLFGGEAVTPQWIRQILEQGAPQHLLHVYGPTENTTFSTWYSIAQVSEDATTLPIGQAIAHTEMRVLNQALQPVPIGIPGELYLGGLGVARGYLNRQELTETCFITIPGSNSKFYKTGDLVRYLPDGNLEFIGRIDHQVKIRGFRIELGEIEMALKQHPEVQDAIVLVDEDPVRGKSLLAYVTAIQILSDSELKQFLQQRLPDYLMPAAYQCLDYFPLTPNGKVDRLALPKPRLSEVALPVNHVLPKNPLEAELVKIWAEVLNLPTVSTCENFFDIGGHSLLAVRLVAKIEQVLERKVSLSQLFQAPTIAQMAQMFQAETGIIKPFQITAPQLGKKTLFWCAQSLGEVNPLVRHLDADQPFFFLDNNFFAIDDPSLYIQERAVQGIQQIKTIQPEGPYYLGGFCLGGMVAFEMALQLQEQGEEVALLTLVESWKNKVPEPQPPRWNNRIVRSWNFHRRELSTLQPSEKSAYLLNRLKNVVKRWTAPETAEAPATIAIPQPLTLEELQIQRAINQGLEAKSTYDARSKYAGATILCFSRNDLDLTNVLAQSGWEDLLSQPPKIYTIPGHHLSLTQEPEVQKLALWLKAALA
jgi:amino acid adenylation domain-containing protein